MCLGPLQLESRTSIRKRRRRPVVPALGISRGTALDTLTYLGPLRINLQHSVYQLESGAAIEEMRRDVDFRNHIVSHLVHREALSNNGRRKAQRMGRCKQNFDSTMSKPTVGIHLPFDKTNALTTFTSFPRNPCSEPSIPLITFSQCRIHPSNSSTSDE